MRRVCELAVEMIHGQVSHQENEGYPWHKRSWDARCDYVGACGAYQNCVESRP
jgi:hypothetical protein